MELLRCGHCNAVAPAEWDKCPRCGQALGESNLRRRLLWVFVALAGLAVVGWVVASLAR